MLSKIELPTLTIVEPSSIVFKVCRHSIDSVSIFAYPSSTHPLSSSKSSSPKYFYENPWVICPRWNAHNTANSHRPRIQTQYHELLNFLLWRFCFRLLSSKIQSEHPLRHQPPLLSVDFSWVSFMSRPNESWSPCLLSV